MKRSGRLRPVAIRKIAQVAERRAFVRQILQERLWCEACDRRLSQHVHEIKTRARGGSILDPANVLALCSRCHRWVHDHPEAAYDRGLLAHSWDDTLRKLHEADPVRRALGR